MLAVTGAKIAPCDDGPTWDEIFEWEEICFADRGDGILRRVRLPECKGTQGWQVAWGAGPRILNSIRCLDDLGVEVERIVYAPVASAAAVLSAEQKQLGALVIDMGFGTTDYAVYSGGTLVQSDSFGIGGGHIANDLSLGLRIPLARAEKLLIEEGGLAPGLVLTVEIKPIVLGAEPGFVRREIEREVFTTIIRCRVEQTLNLVKWRLVNSGVRLDSLLAGVHITGGCALQARHLRIGREGFRHPRPARSGEIPRQLAFRMCNSQHPSCVRNWACEFQ